MMTTEWKNGVHFYLGFDSDGNLVDVKPPEGEELKVDLQELGKITPKQWLDKDIVITEGQESFGPYSLQELKKNNTINIEFKLINKPGNSVCGGSCGNKGFSWC